MLACRAATCSHQAAVTNWQRENERLRASLANTQEQLQEAISTYGQLHLTWAWHLPGFVGS